MARDSSEACQSTAAPTAALAAVCTLDESGRTARWRAVERFIATALDREALPDGVRFAFARRGKTARHLVDFVRQERTCCARFTYAIEDGPGDLLFLLIRARPADLTTLQTLYLAPPR
jgi:hypothetical protein